MEFIDTPLVPFGETLLDMAIPTQLSLKTALVFRMVKELKAKGCLPWTGSHRAELCFDEAITNAILHGNRLDAGKNVRVKLFADDRRWGAIIEDEGDGFKPEDIPNPEDPEFLFRECGRGIMLMNGYLDTLQYNRKGNALLMIRHRQTDPEAVEAAAALAPESPATEVDAGGLRRSQDGEAEIIEVLDDRITDDNVSALRDAVAACPAGAKGILLDLGRVAYISSVGLSALVAMHKAARARNALFLLVALQPGVSDILQSAHLLRLFKVAPDRPTAMAELNKLA